MTRISRLPDMRSGPDRVEVLYGLELALWGGKHLLRIMGRTRTTLLEYERAGRLPIPFVKSGPRRFYTLHELEAAADALGPYGLGNRKADVERWTSEVTRRWASIRADYRAGRVPPSKLCLEFKSVSELEFALGKTGLGGLGSAAVKEAALHLQGWARFK